MSTPSPKPSAGGGVRVHLPANLEPTYANFAMITNSPSEIVIDFAQVMPRLPQANVRARIVMTPFNAKLLLRALSEHMQRFEDQYGEVKLPEGTSLADKLFGNATPDDATE